MNVEKVGDSSTPALSVITLTMGETSGLLETIDSVERQFGAGGIEHLIVNGGGPLSQLPNPTSGVTRVVAYEPPNGIYQAMNAGLSRATGDSVVFLQAGDVLWKDTAAREFVYIADRSPWGYGSLYVKFDGELRLASFSPYRRIRHLLGLGYVPHPSMVMRRGFALGLGGFDVSFPVAADQFLALCAAEVCPPFVSSQILACHNLDGVSADRPAIQIAREFSSMRAKLSSTKGVWGRCEPATTIFTAMIRTGRSAAANWRRVHRSSKTSRNQPTK